MQAEGQKREVDAAPLVPVHQPAYPMSPVGVLHQPPTQELLVVHAALSNLVVALHTQQKSPNDGVLQQLSTEITGVGHLLESIAPAFLPVHGPVLSARQIHQHVQQLYVNATKQWNFGLALRDAKRAMEEAKLPFHLAGGTALGAVREGAFISYDPDIDLQVFRGDFCQKLHASVPMCFHRNGFKDSFLTFGTLEKGLEWSFFHAATGVKVDVFFIYTEPDGLVVHSWTEKTAEFPEGRCEYRYRPFVPHYMRFNGDYYLVPAVSYLIDGYGADWYVPKQFSYHAGITEGHYKNVMRF